MMYFENGDEEASLEGKFGVCETSDECYVCTERVILNFELNQLELPPESPIKEDERINHCMKCLHSMIAPASIEYNPEDVFDWHFYQILAFHPDTRN